MKPSTIRRVLVTGVTGSGGSYMAEHVVNNVRGVSVHGLARWHSTSAARNLAAVAGKVTVHECDLNDFSSVLNVLRAAKPDAIFHLASHANVRASFTNPLAVLENNIMGTANLFEAVRAAGLDPVVQLCSTSEVYGQVLPEEVPITEENALRPSSPYAVSKAAQDLLGLTYFRSYKMKVVRTRMFAYLNPRRTDLFATAFARQVARIEAGLQKVLLHGNLDSVRTMIDVRDAMESYWMATVKGRPGEAYNIGGTTVISVGEFLELLKKKAKARIPTRQDPALLRPSDVTLQVPSVAKFARETGWKPRYSFADSVDHLLAHCRAEVRREKAS